MTPMPTRRELVTELADVHARRVQLDIDELATVALMCDVWSVIDDSAFDSRGDHDPQVLFGERLVQPGGPGTPEVAEFLALEVGPALQISPDAAHTLIGDVLNLRHRLPILWEAALGGRVRAWAARSVARTTEMLSLATARELDARLSPLVTGWSPSKLLVEAERLVVILDDEAEQRRLRARRARHVTITRHALLDGTALVEGRLDAAQAVHLDQTLDRAARSLARGGMAGGHAELRAEALGLLAHPARAHAIIDAELPFDEGPSGPLPLRADPAATPGGTPIGAATCRHGAELIVRVGRGDVGTGHGGGLLDGFGPVTRHHLAEILAGCDSVTIKPVIDLAEPFAVSTYKPPPELRWRVSERDQREVFPFSNRRARSRLIDLDHTIPHRQGGDTALGNLGCLSRRAHRARTHAGFQVEQTAPGLFHWRTPAGQEFWTNAHGTWSTPPPDHHMNDPDTTTSTVLAIALRMLARTAEDTAARAREAPAEPTLPAAAGPPPTGAGPEPPPF